VSRESFLDEADDDAVTSFTRSVVKRPGTAKRAANAPVTASTRSPAAETRAVPAAVPVGRRANQSAGRHGRGAASGVGARRGDGLTSSTVSVPVTIADRLREAAPGYGERTRWLVGLAGRSKVSARSVAEQRRAFGEEHRVVVSLRFTDAERAVLDTLAESAGASRSDVVTVLVARSAR
jgi:hypothetical protein